MSGFNQTIVETVASSRGLGHRSKSTMQEMFPSSPIHSGDIDDDSVRELAQTLLLGDDPGLADGDAYYGFNPPFSRNFTSGEAPMGPGAPNILDVDVGGEGLPGTPYSPNTASPGEGNGVDATAIPDISGDMTGLPANNSFPSSGGGHDSNPTDTSAAIAAQNDSATTIGAYIMVEAYPSP